MMRIYVKAAAVAVLVGLVAQAAQAGVGFGVIEESEETKLARQKERAEELYKEGMQALAEGNTSRAVRDLLWVAKMGKMRTDSPYPERAFNELKKIVEIAKRELQVARELLASESPEAGMMELARISRVYLGLWPAKEAGKLLRDLEGDPKFRQVLLSARLSEDLEEARALEEEAVDLATARAAAEPAEPGTALPPAERPAGAEDEAPKALTDAEREAARLEKLYEAYCAYEKVAAKGPRTAPGKEAAAAVKRLGQDKALAARIERVRTERQAAEWLSLATNYYRAGRPDLAGDYCRKIVSECPDTPQARDAEAMLESIRK